MNGLFILHNEDLNTILDSPDVASTDKTASRHDHRYAEPIVRLSSR